MYVLRSVSPPNPRAGSLAANKSTIKRVGSAAGSLARMPQSEKARPPVLCCRGLFACHTVTAQHASPHARDTHHFMSTPAITATLFECHLFHVRNTPTCTTDIYPLLAPASAHFIDLLPLLR